ncbi:hypothetical protein BKA61DRAFT_225580 [Leptodontidium sp. MPI-SDFR-AT-0119]|nr:hypothetical protein BKA61DRAFT_225580 [Leptodontidium sp. MPI-SDFR-AT-0119]
MQLRPATSRIRTSSGVVAPDTVSDQELRVMIWKYSARQPRAIETSLHKDLYNDLFSIFPTHTLVPGIMHTCSESRTIGLKFYDEFGYYGRTIVRTNFWLKTYINFEIDALLLNGRATVRRFINHLYQDQRAKLFKECKHLAIAVSDIEKLRMIDEETPWPDSRNFETLYLVRNPADGPLFLGNVTFTDIAKLDFATNKKVLNVPKLMKDRMTDLTLVKVVNANRGKYVLKPIRRQKGENDCRASG